MKIIGRLKKFWDWFKAMNNMEKIVFVFFLSLLMQMCSKVGWEWYYQSHPDQRVDDVGFFFSLIFISICIWTVFLVWLLRQIFDFQKKKFRNPQPGSKAFIFMFLMLSSMNGGFPAWILLFVIVLQIAACLVKLVQKFWH